jgi:urease accessory protein
VARVAAHLSVSGPASAAVRLCAFDPLAVHAVLARLAGAVDRIGVEVAAEAGGPLAGLPSLAAPVLDLLAETHTRMEVRLFAS